MVFVILTNTTLNVFLPFYLVLGVRRERLSQLDITRRRSGMALLVSVAVGVLSWLQLQEQVGDQQPHVDLAPVLLANGLLSWEPYSVYGWLQLRFEQAFGVVSRIALAAVCLGAYHVGIFPPSGVASLVAFVTFFGVLFRATGGNLLILWHLTWAVTSSIGGLEGGFGFGWSDVATCAILLVVQAALIASMAWRKVRLGRDGEALGRLAPPWQ